MKTTDIGRTVRYETEFNKHWIFENPDLFAASVFEHLNDAEKYGLSRHVLTAFPPGFLTITSTATNGDES